MRTSKTQVIRIRNSHGHFSFVCGCLLLFSFSLPGSTVKAQVDVTKTSRWTRQDKLGFPVWTAANYVIKASVFDHRHIYLFVEAANFSEQNILKLFNALGDEFEVPDELQIIAYSDGPALQKALDKATNGILCILWAKSPEGRRASRDYEIKTNPHPSGYFRANYFRWQNGKEARIEYSPSPNQEHVKTIYHANPEFEYPDPKKDFIKASARGDLDAIKLRLSQDKSTELLKSAGAEALKAAAANGQPEIVDVLLNAGISANSNAANAALVAAVADGNAEIVQTLLNRGSNANAHTSLDELDDSALMLAALHGHADVARLLMERGATVDDRNHFGETAFMQAALAGFPELVRLLSERGANINARDSNGQTALMLAQDDAETVRTLLTLGVDYKITDAEGQTALMLAIASNESVKQDALIAKGAGKESIEAAKRSIATPLPQKLGMLPEYPEYARERSYQTLIGTYVKLNMKNEAVETGKQMLEVLGDKPHRRMRLGVTYLQIGDRDSAIAQYRILKEQANKAQDEIAKRQFQIALDILERELKK